jgi:hypothetical protein
MAMERVRAGMVLVAEWGICAASNLLALPTGDEQPVRCWKLAVRPVREIQAVQRRAILQESTA